MTIKTDARSTTHLPAEQQAIRAKCFHPSGAFTEFKKQDLEQSIPCRFEQMVYRYPQRVAIKTQDHLLTYGDLNGAANRIARAVLAYQTGEANPVGLLFETDASLTATMLAVLKAGKFFVPLDPSWPKARLVAALEDSQAELMITTRANFSLAEEIAGRDLRVMEFESVDTSVCDADLGITISPSAHVVLIYTSGSTGEPKGVLQNHRNVLHRVMVQTNAVHLCEHDRLSLLTSGTSNAVMYSFFTLLNGAALLPFNVQKQGVVPLAHWLREEKVSVCPISAPLFRNLAESLRGQEGFPELRLLRLTSETVHKTEVDLYKKYFSPNCVAVNMLSSTESGPLRTYFIDHKTDLGAKEVPVGYPVEDKEVILIDPMGNQLGFDEVGEIAVRSRYLSSGYWRRPGLTEAKFISDAKGADETTYLTGDLGVMLPDGCLIYKGRKDFRVKIRGYGVELSEIEKALLEHGAIKEALLVSQPTALDEASLIAYFTPVTEPGPAVNELRMFLRQKLPDYMIPSIFVKLAAMPLTSMGKIDRRMLPKFGNARPNLDTPFVAPTSPSERKLAQIWAEVFSIDSIGIYDNFLDLGGHSLTATRIIARVIQQFHVEVPVQLLFRSPTVAAMAAVILQHHEKPLNDAELNRMIGELESLTDEQAEQMLSNQRPTYQRQK